MQADSSRQGPTANFAEALRIGAQCASQATLLDHYGWWHVARVPAPWAECEVLKAGVGRPQAPRHEVELRRRARACAPAASTATAEEAPRRRRRRAKAAAARQVTRWRRREGRRARDAAMADDDEIESWEESGLPFWKCVLAALRASACSLSSAAVCPNFPNAGIAVVWCGKHSTLEFIEKETNSTQLAVHSYAVLAPQGTILR